MVNGETTEIGATSIGNITMTNLQEEAAKAPIVGVKEKVAVVKAAPINYFKEAWKQCAPVAGNIGFAAIADAVERVSGWSLSPWVWDTIIGFVSFGSAMLMISFALDMFRKKRNNDTVTRMLVASNTNDDNFVQLIDCDPEVVNAYRANGYKIITR